MFRSHSAIPASALDEEDEDDDDDMGDTRDDERTGTRYNVSLLPREHHVRVLTSCL